MPQDTSQAASAVTFLGRAQKVAQEVRVGKDILELLTGAMYVDPLTVYREYIQNAADSIDEARTTGLLRSSLHGRVDITIDPDQRSITIRDNGSGVPAAEFVDRLTALGDSKKRGQKYRGFRGVGRLAGLGYAQQVVFRTRYLEERRVSEITWDGRKLRDLLRNSDYRGDLAGVVREIAEVSARTADGCPPHFFEVELRRVARLKNDMLLNPDEIRSYLAQVAPVPFSPSFSYRSELEEYLRAHDIGHGIHVYLAGHPEPIYRPFEDSFRISDKVTDRFVELERIEIPGLDGTQAAVGWILHHSYFGALPRRTGFAGLRFRAGDIQVGTNSILDGFFKEQRFNSWCVGELHVLSDKIVPNGRRDEFEFNAHYQNLHGHAAAIAARLSKLCRDRSILRERLREAHQIYQDALHQLQVARDRTVPMLVRQHYRDAAAGAVSRLDALVRKGSFSEAECGLILDRIAELKDQLATRKKNASAASDLAFLPERKRKVFLEVLAVVLESCESPQHGAALVKRIIRRARRVRA